MVLFYLLKQFEFKALNELDFKMKSRHIKYKNKTKQHFLIQVINFSTFFMTFGKKTTKYKRKNFFCFINKKPLKF